MQRVAVLSGAGISAESGLRTFRDSDGLWEGHHVNDVATPEAWARDPEKVLSFYNERRKAAQQAQPNAAHQALVALERGYDVTIITQNVDDLHERAGSSKIIHLHGQLSKAQSSVDPGLVYPIEDWKLTLGDCCELGSQLRPFIVWFGEPVPMMEIAAEVASEADIFIVVGTSLVVYPAAGLVNCVRPGAPIYVVDPAIPAHVRGPHVTAIAKRAGEGVPELVEQLLADIQA